MFTGSMFGAGPSVFAVWAYAIGCCDRDGVVELNPAYLASVLGDTRQNVEQAIAYLSGPDPESRSKDENGKRIVKMGQFSYYLVNWKKYHDLRNEEERREQNKQAQQRSRDKKGNASANVSKSQQESASVSSDKIGKESAKSAHTDTNTDTDNNSLSYSLSSFLLDKLTQATNGLLEINRTKCLEELERLRPPLTEVEIDPVLGWLQAQQSTWSQREPKYRPHLATIIKTKAWDNHTPAAGRSPSSGGRPSPPANEQTPMCKCGRAREISTGNPWCRHCQAEIDADIAKRKADRKA